MRFARNIYKYMYNVVNEREARKQNSISLVQRFCFMITEAASHEKIFVMS